MEAKMEEAYGKKLVRAEMARLQVAMMTMLRTEETDTKEKDNEINHLQRDLQRVQVKTPSFMCTSNHGYNAHAYLSLSCYTRRTERGCRQW